MENVITILQIVVSIALVVFILLQQRDSDSAGFLGGGGGGGGYYQQRRGMERLFFVLTIILTIIFAGLALTSLFYKETEVPTDTSLIPPVTSTDSGTAPALNTTSTLDLGL